MFDRYIIVEDTLTNVVGDDGTVTGFSVGLRLPYYRGLGLSMVEEVRLTVDGVTVPDEAVSLTVHGRTYPLTGLGSVLDDRWELGEVATVTVDRPGGLATGQHDVAVSQRLRISYMPVPGGGADRKTLTLRAA